MPNYEQSPDPDPWPEQRPTNLRHLAGEPLHIQGYDEAAAMPSGRHAAPAEMTWRTPAVLIGLGSLLIMAGVVLEHWPR